MKPLRTRSAFHFRTRWRIRILVAIGTLFLQNKASAQGSSNNNSNSQELKNEALTEIINKIDYYSHIKSSSVLFAHFDKNIYTTNENVWFTTYTLDRTSHRAAADLLEVILINNKKSSVVLERKFLMKNGIASGNILLNDSLPAGNYTFLLYSNRMFNGKPEDVFIRPITIKESGSQQIRVELSSIDTQVTSSKTREFMVTAFSKNNSPIPDAKLTYSVGDFKSSAETNKDGKYLISIPAHLIKGSGEILELLVKYHNNIEHFNLTIPALKKQFSVKFYPEGGYLIDATRSLVGWEVKTSNDVPVRCDGILYKDQKPIDTFQTDKCGLGRFFLTPLAGSSYTVKLIKSQFGDSVYMLPEIILKSPALSLSNALVNDSLSLRIMSKSPCRATVIVHNYRQVFFAFNANLTPAGTKFTVDLKDIPKGLATVTVLDSLERPLLERIFFAHYNHRSLLGIQASKSTFTRRDKVKIALSFSTADTGIVSVSCVQGNRVQPAHNNDIENYFFLEHELTSLPLKTHYFGDAKDDRELLEEVLLIKGWRQFSWQESMESTPADTSINETLLQFTGRVLNRKSPLKKPTTMVIMTDSSTTTLKTDRAGDFILNNQSMLCDPRKKVHLMIMENNKDAFNIQINDPFTKINAGLLNQFDPAKNHVKSDHIEEPFLLKGLEQNIQLKEVKITAGSGKADLWVAPKFRQANTSPCGDYVCRFNFLNCPIHPAEADNRPAVVGETYYTKDKFTTVVYTGCPVTTYNKSEYLQIDGIKYDKVFYGSDYSILNPPEPDFISTIFWKPGIYIGGSKTVSLEFYTSDIIGNFKVIIQGITQNDVVYAEKEFEVK